VLLPRGWGRCYLQWKKLKIGKVKTKKGYVQIEKIKTKKNWKLKN